MHRFMWISFYFEWFLPWALPPFLRFSAPLRVVHVSLTPTMYFSLSKRSWVFCYVTFLFVDIISTSIRNWKKPLTAFVNLSIAPLAFIKSSSFFLSCILSLSLSDLIKTSANWMNDTFQYHRGNTTVGLVYIPSCFVQCLVVNGFATIFRIIGYRTLFGCDRIAWIQTRSRWCFFATTLKTKRKNNWTHSIIGCFEKFIDRFSFFTPGLHSFKL